MTLRSKISLFTVLIAVSVGFLVTLSIRGVIKDAFRKELEKRALSITRNLSDRIADSIVRKDYFSTSRAFEDVMAKERDVEYVFVTRDDGPLFVHTFKNGYPPDLLSWNPLGESRMNIMLLDTEKGLIRDVAVKVFEGSGAELHLGIREDGLHQTLLRLRNITVPAIMFVILLGIIASLIFSRMITKPISKFVEFTKVLGRGEYGKRVDVKYGDEMGYLARSFNTLSMQLKDSRKKMEEAYTYTHLIEAEKIASIGQISAGLAHELKNPLTSLKMLFQAFREQPDMTPEDAEVIAGEIEKMENIIENFMGFARERGLRLEDVNISEVIDRVIALATYDIENAGITVRREMIEALPVIQADRSMLEHLFLNLVINAVHAMPDGGEIRISGKSDNDFVEVMVWDHGRGIPQEIRSKIFNPFFTTKEGGTGLGLSIAYNIVKSHGGMLFFNSNEGSGTVFTARLPIKREDGQDTGS
jgi:signal transduction histidine kinase